jgi:hypothetical protein
MVLRIVAMGLALIAGGCASVARGTSEQVAFDTVPSGAEVRVVIPSNYTPPEGQGDIPPPPTMACVTPCVLQVKRADKMAVTVTKAGFATESFPLTPQASGEGVGTSVLGNMLLAGGVLGVVVDGVSGAALDHCPNPVRITLRSLPGSGRNRNAPAVPAAPGGGFTFDPVAACKAQTEAKYASNTPPGDNSAR